jgi:hypothetical protein
LAYEGCFDENGRYSGEGVLTYPDIMTHAGIFENGLLARGTITYKYGNSLEGSFVRGKLCGEGTYSQKDGTRFVGAWKDNQMHGEGKFTYSSGNVFEGTFAEGKMVKGIMYLKEYNESFDAKLDTDGDRDGYRFYSIELEQISDRSIKLEGYFTNGVFTIKQKITNESRKDK